MLFSPSHLPPRLVQQKSQQEPLSDTSNDLLPDDDPTYADADVNTNANDNPDELIIPEGNDNFIEDEPIFPVKDELEINLEDLFQ